MRAPEISVAHDLGLCPSRPDWSLTNRVFRAVRAISKFAQEETERKFRGSGCKFVSGLFFLRVLCPVLVSPAKLGITQRASALFHLETC